VLTLRQLTKRFGSLVAVDDVDLVVRYGEVLGLLGPNGAGKTTTISMIVGTLTPDQGTVTIEGHGSPAHAAVRRQIGYCPQALAVYDMLSATENLRLFGSLYDLRGATLESRISWALDFAGLADRARDRTVTFSGGMKRRLNLACALIHEPRLLLLDEPTVGVDPQSRNLIFERIEELRARGLTVIYTTHYMEEATRLCDRIAIMDHGRILALDTLDGLFQAHGGTTRVVFDLHGDPAESNLPLPPRATLVGRQLTVETDDAVRTVREVADIGHPIQGFHTDRHTLEDVFLRLTGRRLRD
jgi:ABC-2 type transport system ATP-binding protein